MCLSPLLILNRALHSHYAVTSPLVEVPCGHCESCRDLYKTSWEDRLCLEVSDWYAKGGAGLMLTFTYNNAFLPHFTREGVSVPCFSSSDITTFLSRLKTRCSREFGEDFYRYFICSEYGSDTQRPHYHAAFLIRDKSKYVQFVELCRSLWCWLSTRDKRGHYRLSGRLGFMFPKRVNGEYVDDKCRPKSPLFRSQLAGAKYVCKYVCKDLSYCKLPKVVEFSQKYEDFQACMPKSWKSNNLGFSAVKTYLSKPNCNIENLLKNGIWSPLQKKFIPLWQSAVSRLMYNNVWNGRISTTTGKKLYDRELSDFGHTWMWFSFKSRLLRTQQKIYERMLLVQQTPKLAEQFGFKLPRLFIASDFANYALWHCLLSSCSRVQLNSQFGVLGSNLSTFFSPDSWRPFYMLRHDSVSLSDCSFPVDDTSILPDDVYNLYTQFESAYKDLCIFLSKGQLIKFKERGEATRRAKEVQGVYGFPRSLC